MNLAHRIEIWPIDRLKPYVRNARTHSDEQVAKIAASIVEFGFTNPLLVGSTDGIIAGHGRLLAARELGLAEVPVIVLDYLTDAQRRAYILADNKLAEGSGWDQELLAAELAMLQTDGFNVDAIGFSDLEINAMFEDGILPDPADQPSGPAAGDRDGPADTVTFGGQGKDESRSGASYLKFKVGKYEIPLSDDEVQALTERAADYYKTNGLMFGFMTELLRSQPSA